MAPMRDDRTMPRTDNELLNRIYRLEGPEQAAAAYDEWAATYDRDTVEGMGYVAPGVTADRVVDLLAEGATVLDAGCGTGLVGEELHRRRSDLVLDGLDVSPGMLAFARERGVYRDLAVADLTGPVARPDDAYDAVVCVGTLTRGHLGPEPLAEMVRVVRPGGVVVATVLDTLWEEGGFRAFVEELAAAGRARVVEAELRPYHREEGIDCRLLVLGVE